MVFGWRLGSRRRLAPDAELFELGRPATPDTRTQRNYVSLGKPTRVQATEMACWLRVVSVYCDV